MGDEGNKIMEDLLAGVKANVALDASDSTESAAQKIVSYLQQQHKLSNNTQTVDTISFAKANTGADHNKNVAKARLAQVTAAQNAVSVFLLHVNELDKAYAALQNHIQETQAHTPTTEQERYHTEQYVRALNHESESLKARLEESTKRLASSQKRFETLRERTTGRVLPVLRAQQKARESWLSRVDAAHTTQLADALARVETLASSSKKASALLQPKARRVISTSSVVYAQSLFRDAIDAHPHFGKLVHELGQTCASKHTLTPAVNLCPLKSVEQAAQEIAELHSGNFAALLDIVCGSVTCEDVAGLSLALDTLCDLAGTGEAPIVHVLRATNLLDAKNATHSQASLDVAVVVHVAVTESKHVCELQFKLSPLAAKSSSNPISANVREVVNRLCLADDALGKVRMSVSRLGQPRLPQPSLSQAESNTTTDANTAHENRSQVNAHDDTTGAVADDDADDKDGDDDDNDDNNDDNNNNADDNAKDNDDENNDDSKDKPNKDANANKDENNDTTNKPKPQGKPAKRKSKPHSKNDELRKAVRALVTQIENGSCQLVDIMHTRLVAAEWAALGNALRKPTSSVTELDFAFSNLGAGEGKFAKAFCGIDSKQQATTETADAASSSSTKISRLHDIRTLHLLGNSGIPPECLSAMICSGLQKLGLRECALGPQGMAVVSKALNSQRCTKLRVLNLASNELGAEGAQHLAGPLAEMKDLISLNISANKFGPEGAKHLIVPLSSLTSLTSLNLGFNELGNEGAKQIGESISHSKSLLSLDLWRNKLDDEGAQSFATQIASLPLKSLNLAGNNIGDDSKEKIKSTLSHITSLAL